MSKIVQFVKKAASGQLGIWLRFSVLLLLVSAGFFALMSVGGCGDGCKADCSILNKLLTSRATGKIQPIIRVDQHSAPPGYPLLHKFSVATGVTPPPNLALKWVPPEGSTDFSFNPAPDNPNGPPPFTWSSFNPNHEIEVEFNLPPEMPPEHPDGYNASELLQVSWGEGPTASSDSAAFYTFVYPLSRSGQSSAPPTPPRGRVPSQGPPQQLDLWEVESWLNPHGITLTTELCQDWADQLRSDSAFIAIRTPISTTAPTQSHPLPIFFGGKYSNTLQLVRHDPFGPVLTATLEYRPEQFTFANNELPAAEGYEWLALGLEDDPLTCPPGLAIPADGWSLVSRILLDLSNQPDNGAGCTLLAYYCYEGQELPSGMGSLPAGLLGRLTGITAYEGWGVTCAGPRYVPLEGDPIWELSGTGAKLVTPTQPLTITFHHDIQSDLSRDIDLEHSSSLDVAWGLYGGTWDEPDLDDPLTPPIAVPAGMTDIWLVSAPVPTTTSPGLYSLILTATALTDPTPPSWTTSDLVWIGAWTPPPPPPCTGLTTVSLGGPSSGGTDTAYTFQAAVSPPTATTPLSYTWEATGQALQVHPLRGPTDVVSYTWGDSGLYRITVTVSNECQAIVSDFHTISIGDSEQYTIYLPVVLKADGS